MIAGAPIGSGVLDWPGPAPWTRSRPMETIRPGAADRATRVASVRSIFLSDVHLGCPFAKAESLLRFLRSHQAEHLYLVGDFFDGWKLKGKWRWNSVYNELMKHIMEMSRSGGNVYYAPGNHDEFLRPFVSQFGNINIQDEFIHWTADRRRLLVLHGDRFDRFEQNARVLSVIGDYGYSILLRANRWLNWVRARLGMRYWSLSGAVKGKVKTFACFVSDFERSLAREAREKGCDGVICGHLHQPVVRMLDNVLYCNTGDWVESCTAILEHHDGQLELVASP